MAAPAAYTVNRNLKVRVLDLSVRRPIAASLIKPPAWAGSLSLGYAAVRNTRTLSARPRTRCSTHSSVPDKSSAFTSRSLPE